MTKLAEVDPVPATAAGTPAVPISENLTVFPEDNFSTARSAVTVPVIEPLAKVPALPVAKAAARSAPLAPLAPAVNVKPAIVTVWPAVMEVKL